jgi:hypothetical protein
MTREESSMRATIRRLLSGKGTKLALIAVPTIVAGSMMFAPAASAAPATTSAAASAATVAPAGMSACALGDLCFWVDAGYLRAMGHVSGNNAYWGAFPQSECQTGTWNDCASSLYNHGRFDAVLVYQDAGPSGSFACVARGASWSDLTQRHSNDGHGLNDAISSNAWLSVATCS